MTTPAPVATTPTPPSPAVAPPAPGPPAAPGAEATGTPTPEAATPTQRWVIPVMPLVLIAVLFTVGLTLMLIDLFGGLWGSLIVAGIVALVIAVLLVIRSRRRAGKGILGRGRHGPGSSRFGRGGGRGFGSGGSGRGGLGRLFGGSGSGSKGGLGSRLRSALGLGRGKGKTGLGKSSSGLGPGSGSKTGLGKGSSGSGSGSSSSRPAGKGSGKDDGDSLIKKARKAAWERFKQSREQAEEEAGKDQAAPNEGKETVTASNPAANPNVVAAAGPDAAFLRWGQFLGPAAEHIGTFANYATHQANVAANMPVNGAFKDEMNQIAIHCRNAAQAAAEWSRIWKTQSHEDIDDLLHPKGGPHIAAKADVARTHGL